MYYCVCSCGKTLYDDEISLRKHKNCDDNWLDNHYFSEQTRDYGYKDGFLYGSEVAKKDIIYGDPYDDYLNVKHIDVPQHVFFNSDDYEDGYIRGYENGYSLVFVYSKIYNCVLRELSDNINLKMIEENFLYDKHLVQYLSKMIS